MTIRTTIKTVSLSPVALALAGILVTGQTVAADAKKTDSATSKNSDSRYASNADMLVIADEPITKDEIGYSRVYTRDIVNLYKGKKEIETYRGNTVSDLFSGMVGMYSGDSRNSGALDPNIRGVQGEGRIPVTVDGTEQSITVWRGYAGVNNRNYVDPNLVSSIYVEKGPSLDPGIHSGIGGSVAMKTLDTDDIVAPGEKYGMEMKLETGDNSVSPRKNPYENLMDYRDLPHPEAAMMGQWRLYFDGTDRVDPRTSGKNHFFNDKAMRIAAGTRQEYFDVMVAYAWRNKGNYFSGKRSAEKYGYRTFASKEEFIEFAHGTPKLPVYDPYISQIGLIQLPGREVTNTSLVTESWLLKGTLKLANNQQLKLGYRQTDSRFGDIMPSRIIGPLVDYAGNLNQVAEWPLSWVKQQAVNLDYAWKPEDNQWLDLKASLWTTLNDSKTNTSGGVPGDGIYFDKRYNDRYQLYYYANGGDWTLTDEQRAYYKTLNAMINPENKQPTSADSDLPNTNGRFNTIDGAAYYAKNNRVGFNLSNRMQLTSMLNLTLMGNFQYETLKGTNAYSDFFAHPDRYADEIKAGIMDVTYMSDNIGLPRNGKRQESNFAFNFRFTPLEWLEITAGARYTNYSLHDDYIDSVLDAEQNKTWVDTGVETSLRRALTSEEFEAYKKANDSLWLKRDSDSRDWPQDEREWLRSVVLIDGSGQPHERRFAVDPDRPYEGTPYFGSASAATRASGDAPKYAIDNVVWRKDKYGRFNPQDNPFTNGTVNLTETVSSPVDGSKVPKYVTGGFLPLKELMGSRGSEQLANARKQTGHGWIPLASVSVFFTPNARAYLRYSESLRYPSMFEGTLGFSNRHRSGASYGRLGYLWKPEHAKNWEVGYVYSFSHLLPHTRYADFRINYYHNTTENIIDRDTDYNYYQYDKQLLSGMEVQGRFDTGRVFGDVGVVRTLRDQVCDAAVAFISSSVPEWYITGERRVPVCQNGGMASNSYLANMIPPRWSVVANMGSRFFNEKLEIGTRFTYYSRVYDTRYKSLEGSLPSTLISDAALRWQPVAVYDAYARYKINRNLIAELTGNNLTNLYYLDPMSRSYVPAPGRTIRISLTGRF